MKLNGKLISVGIFTATTASLCCITPLVAVIAGGSSLVSTFSWLEPLRPYLIGLTILILTYVWYQTLRPINEVDCDCEDNVKSKFTQSKTFLLLMTIFATLMLAFPVYSEIFYSKIEKPLVIANSNNGIIEFTIQGMTCTGCEEHIKSGVNKLPGIIDSKISYQKGKAVIEYNDSITSIEEIHNAIAETGYKVIDRKNNRMEVLLQSIITCPECGNKKKETMPSDSCQYFFECDNCKAFLKPKLGDCCVFCSYGSVKCPPIQQGLKCSN